MERLIYTGIGSRLLPGQFYENPNEPRGLLYKWGKILAESGFILRSGAAQGADEAFERGCNTTGGKKEIYLPWKGFNGSDSDLYYIPPEAYEVAGDVYGATWRWQKAATKKFMARNMMQVMGLGLDEPSRFVICWTRDGCTTAKARTLETGGTGQAISYADEMGIPIFNFQVEGAEQDFIDFFLSQEELCANIDTDE